MVVEQYRREESNNLKLVQVKAEWSLRRELVLELRDVTCHMGSHSVTCHPTQVNALTLQSVSWYSIYLPRRDGRLSWPRLPLSAPAGSRTRDLSITSRTPYHYTTESPNITITIHTCTYQWRSSLITRFDSRCRQWPPGIPSLRRIPREWSHSPDDPGSIGFDPGSGTWWMPLPPVSATSRRNVETTTRKGWRRS